MIANFCTILMFLLAVDVVDFFFLMKATMASFLANFKRSTVLTLSAATCSDSVSSGVRVMLVVQFTEDRLL